MTITSPVVALDKLRYINYPGFGALFDIWRRHFFPRRLTLTEQTVIESFLEMKKGS
ncbi:MAG: hypothetical protein HYT77_10145 [Deltaproteobacteria bacterium]|nr:hypothetical protein [Deltaproteobacteria bacterium]